MSSLRAESNFQSAHIIHRHSGTHLIDPVPGRREFFFGLEVFNSILACVGRQAKRDRAGRTARRVELVDYLPVYPPLGVGVCPGTNISLA
jgi:hypothetical protein